jgi:hypothetical protein
MLLALAVGAFLLVGGCDMTDSGDSEEPGQIVAGERLNLRPDTWVVLAQFDIAQPGRLVGDIRAGMTSDMSGGFEHVASGELLGMAHGPTPLYSRASVTAAHVAAGTAWRYIAINGTDQTVNAAFTVRFQPD